MSPFFRLRSGEQALAVAQSAYENAVLKTEAARLARNNAIRVAAHHMSHADIARATGLGRARIGQIAGPQYDQEAQ